MNVLLFARLRDLAAAEAIELPYRDGETVQELRRRLAEKIPAMASLLARSAIAVNGDYAKDEQAIVLDDEIAVIPPVSGG